MIPFNKPALTGKEITYIRKVLEGGTYSGNGFFTKQVHDFFKKSGFQQPYLTSSCSAALEMAALVAGINEGDEIILPSFTFVSTANAFAFRGAKLVFADSSDNSPNIDVTKAEALITKKTKAIVCVHYGGIACDMKALTALAKKHNIFLIEDAAHAIGCTYKGKPLGSIGNMGTLSFHETKNINAGEAGLLCINEKSLVKNADIIWEKGTNRKEFDKGQVDKYEWVGLGSSFLASEITAAFLCAQLEALDKINDKRIKIWNEYHQQFDQLNNEGKLAIPHVPEYASHNGHIYYLVCSCEEERKKLILHLKKAGVHAVFHYQSLHQSKYFKNQYSGSSLSNADKFSECLVRLPLFYSMKKPEQLHIIKSVLSFYK
ncbi:MAG: dTDP-4-amino-4,6-dideoxygalactose transaminase [Bacteroidota bacterium]